MSETAANDAIDQNQTEQQFSIQRIYVKDVSFESPNSPSVFQNEWKPNVELELNTFSKPVAPNHHEVVLKVNVTAKIGDKIAFLAEVQQAGIFVISNFDNNQTLHMLGSYCPNILFPYIRETISDVIIRGGFPQFILSPVNFDALYAQHLQKMSQNQDQNQTEQIN